MRHRLKFQWLIYLRCEKWNLTPCEALSGVSLRRWRSSRPGLSDSPGLTHGIRRCLDEESTRSPTQTPKHNKHTHTHKQPCEHTLLPIAPSLFNEIMNAHQNTHNTPVSRPTHTETHTQRVMHLHNEVCLHSDAGTLTGVCIQWGV